MKQIDVYLPISGDRLARESGVDFIHDSKQQCKECPYKCQNMAPNPGDVATDIRLEVPARYRTSMNPI